MTVSHRWAVTLAVAVLALLGIAGPNASAAVTPLDVRTHADPAGDVKGPLDVTSVGFDQKDTQLQLSIETAGDWDPFQLSTAGPRRLCVELTYGPAKDRRKDVCVLQTTGLPVVEWADVAADGSLGPAQRPAAFVTRPQNNLIFAQFPPSAIDLPDGPFRWRVVSRWADDKSCSPKRPECVDAVPDVGTFSARAALLVQPRCYGAAARSGRDGCKASDRSHDVLPSLSDALLTPNAFCIRGEDSSGAHPCAFGWLAQKDQPRIALVGDSMAAHWRGAVELVATSQRWGAVSMTQAGCPFTPNPTYQTPALNARCARHFQSIKSYLQAHPSVSTIYVNSHRLPDDGKRGADYARGWAQMPASVKSIILIRDAPSMPVKKVPGCIERSLKRRGNPGRACAQPRKNVLLRDIEANAVRASKQDRVHLIDFTKYMCSKTRCFPVVGGALVHKDGGHLSRAFAGSIGPFMLEQSRPFLR
jgi:hypothetical protein